MAILKCKMCGGDLAIVEGVSIAKCEYCGSVQTVPKADDEKKLNFFARADRLRAACEFDKAAAIYEMIIADFPEEAEAYWGLILCNYGIEYVDDPATNKKVPTCHRSSFDSVLAHPDFQKVLEYADDVCKSVYREEAIKIDALCNDLITISTKEAPYDIFICYKETDENGDRTLDSLLAQDIYDALTQKGYRVFFSRITLEDKLGEEYEPYIFAALNSAKIMLVVGTDASHYQAVWVKNEWNRYLKLMSQDRTKHLFPCYKNITPHDLPREFQRLQGQDIGKIGAIQDLLRGIEKCLALPEIAEKQAPRISAPPKTVQEPPTKKRIQANKSKKPALLVVAGILIVALLAGALLKNKQNVINTGSVTDKDFENRIAQLRNSSLTINNENYIEFGSYEQDGNPSTTEPIEWVPLAISGNRVLLISRYALDTKEMDYATLWRDSSLREWLNDPFLQEAFSAEEQKAIIAATCDNPIVTEFVGDKLTISGDEGETIDRVFLLSAPEVVTYFGSSAMRYTKASPYAVSKGAYVAENGNTWWAIRTTACNFVGAESGFGSTGMVAIRPAIWIEIQ